MMQMASHIRGNTVRYLADEKIPAAGLHTRSAMLTSAAVNTPLRCLLCDQLIREAKSATPEPSEDRDAICARCRALPPEERRKLRNQAMIRMLRKPEGGT
jgi:hypothetical protein